MTAPANLVEAAQTADAEDEHAHGDRADAQMAHDRTVDDRDGGRTLADVDGVDQRHDADTLRRPVCTRG